MRSLRVTDKFLLGIFLLLPVFLSSPPRLLAVTIVEIYNDDAGEGFLDETALTDDQKTALAALGNDADTVGEARKNAFEHVTSILENSLADTSTIRISTKFVIFEGQEDPNDPDKCAPPNQGIFVIASAGTAPSSYFSHRFIEGDVDNPGLGTAYAPALAEALAGQNLNGDNADIFINFSRCIAIYYGITQRALPTQIDFILVALHEIIHGLGFFHQINEDGSFPLRLFNLTEPDRLVAIRSRAIYDEQIYSETDDDLLINLTSGKRAAAITSDTGLLWEGTDSGRNSCSYGQFIAEGKPDSAKSLDGKPRLHAPSTYRGGSSVAHTHANTEDIMEAMVPIPENMDLALGILKDMGWSVSADGFPTICGPDVTASFGEASYSVTEGGSVDVEVTLSADPKRSVSIPFMVNSSSTTETGDYSLQPAASVTFASGDTSKNITLAATDDTADDDDETVILDFGTLPEGVTAGTTPSTTVTITDNDDPPSQTLAAVSFGEASYSVTEGGSVNVEVTLSVDPGRDVEIPFTVNSSSTAGTGDYSLQPASTVTFASGDTSKNITLAAADDTADDDDETVILDFGTLPQGISEGTTTSTTVTITDNDDPAVTASFGAATYSVTEGASVAVAVTLSADPERTVTIPVTVNATSTALPADYSLLPAATVTFASGETSKNITVAATDDTADEEESETVILGFGTLPERVSAGTTSSTTVTIADNDDPDVTVSFGEASYSVTEGGSVNVAVTLSADPERSVAIPFMVDSSSTATTGDYSLQPASTVTFASGETTKNIAVAATDDTADDDDETVVIDFGTLPLGVSVGTTSSITVTITDNDDPPAVTVSFGASSYSVAEGGAVNVAVTLSANPERSVAIPFMVDSSSTATTADYSLQPAATVTFASGDTSKNITIAATDDTADETNETVILGFGTLPERVTAGTRSSTNVTITDNDDPQPPSLSAESGGGCSVGAEADHRTESAAAHLLAAIALVLPAFFRKNLPAG